MQKVEEKLTEHFTKAEFKCECGTCYGGAMNPDFMEKLEALRVACGFPLVVNSGFRCSTWNEKQGGERMSYHLVGQAVDFACKDATERFKIVYYAGKVGIRGIRVFPTFVHLDHRDDLHFFIK